MSALTPMEFNIGVASLVYVVINFAVGITIISKYFKFKQKDLLLVGLAWIGVGLPWLVDGLKIFFFLYDVKFTDFQLILLFSLVTVFFTSLFVFFWLAAITNLLNIENLALRDCLTGSFIVFLLFLPSIEYHSPEIPS